MRYPETLPFRYMFPAHKYVPGDTLSMMQQLDKVIEECEEARVEAFNVWTNKKEPGRAVLVPSISRQEAEQRLRRELLDTIHACETALRAWPPYTVAMDRDWVIEKNAARGYYGGAD